MILAFRFQDVISLNGDTEQLRPFNRKSTIVNWQ